MFWSLSGQRSRQVWFEKPADAQGGSVIVYVSAVVETNAAVVLMYFRVCVSNTGSQWRTRPSQRRIGVTPPCTVGLLAEPPANHTTFWEGEMCLKPIDFKHFIKTTNRHYTHISSSPPNLFFFLLSCTSSLCYLAFCNRSICCAVLWFTPTSLTTIGGYCIALLCYSMLPHVSHVPVGLYTNIGLPETSRTRGTLKILGMGESRSRGNQGKR